MPNLAAHSIDILHWALGVAGPTAVTSAGGRFSLRDNGETPDTQDAIIEYPGCTAIWSHREAARGQESRTPSEYFGPRGSMAISRKGFVVTPDAVLAPENAVPRFGGAHPVGGPVRVAAKVEPRYCTEAVKDESGDEHDQSSRQARDFLDCVTPRRD